MATEAITIYPVISDNNTNRLNYIAGRYLSEQEFDLMQTYVDERCEDLLLTQKPGIVQGLDVLVPENFDEFPIQINPGLGVSWSGKAVTNRLPIRFRWQELLDNYLAEKAMTGLIQDGFYFLTLRRKIVLLDISKKADPCTRTEEDPLRDSRIETLTQVNLQYLPIATSLMSASRQKVAVRILKKMLNKDYFSQNPDEIKLSLVKIKSNQLEWIDVNAGRFLAKENAAYFTFLDYWQSIVRSKNTLRLDGPGVEIKNEKTLRELLDIDYLPAAGKFPEPLIEKIAGEVIRNSAKKDTGLWRRPVLNFNPDGLQIEIVPIPANSVNGVIQSELNRGVVDLLNGESDRIRLMVTVNPDDYYPKLMDLPEIDMDLIVTDLVAKQIEAADAHFEWEKVYFDLYENLENNIIFNVNNIADLKTREIFSAVRLINAPMVAFSSSIISSVVKRKALGIPDLTPSPDTVDIALNKIVDKRAKSLTPNQLMPRPYSLRDELTVSNGQPARDAKNNADGLVEKRIKTKNAIGEIEDYIVRTNQLIDELRDYMSLQRQQLDSITVSFSTLAGGVQGDGTGLKLMRWSDKLTFATAIAATATEVK